MPDQSRQPSPSAATGHTRLGDFLRQNVGPIVAEWSSFAKTRTPASDSMTALALRDHIEEILTFIADDLESPQTGSEQVRKSQGEGPKEDGFAGSAAEIHAALRLIDGFDIDQMVSEYRALRASVVKLWRAANHDLDRHDFNDLTRFHEAVDQAATESISHYSKAVERSRNLFLGILGHDLRNPIGAAGMTAELMPKVGPLNPKQTYMASQIVACTFRANVILTDLLDLTRTQLGSEIPIVKQPTDMGVLSTQLVDEMRAFYPGRDINLEITGDTEGEWDRSRLGQVFSNLIGNAIAHGLGDTPVNVAVRGEPQEVVLSVQNNGTPIPGDRIDQIFDSLVRGDEHAEDPAASSHLGLGLYIAKRIIDAHGGTIGVTSSQEGGTTFTAKLPRH